ncbi:hypothetical protein GPECTOR_192g311 [Gonium pectorale]|uniref:Uncharacterized protein n=1 Tax=Gonium pectorale TaxID=33097 RepID=A0A150FY93_GONPE|nr:hypothetical protein GPECTOR_192g311 [Gonium pectorale]|eukprot:KXZ42165.1 hypothetical protein GPECTOR_192g311 [Gonium pectorale]
MLVSARRPASNGSPAAAVSTEGTDQAALAYAAAHSAAASGLWPWSASGPGRPANLKFLHNVLPVLLEATLAELAASCGPGLRTTTLLLNTYNRPGPAQAWVPDGGPACRGSLGGHGGDGGAVERSRWARRAIARHAAATLHLLPPAGAATAATTGAAAVAGAQGRDYGGGCGSLHAVLTRGLPSGEDGDALFTGSLALPVRLPDRRFQLLE